MVRMLERIDDVSNRIFSYFFHPIVNLSLVTWIFVSWFNKNIKIDAGRIESSEWYKSFVVVVAKVYNNLLSDAFANIAKGLHDNSSVAGGVILGSIIFVAVLAIIIDRVLRFFGRLMPVHIEFDSASFARSEENKDWLDKVYYALKADVRLPFKDAYGIACSYLGEYSNDKFRDAHRESIIQESLASLKMFSYAKAYVFLSLLMLLMTLILGTRATDLVTVLVVMILGVLFGLASAVAYAHKNQELLEYDLDSFLWLRTHKPDKDQELVQRLADGSRGQFKPTDEPPSGRISKWIGRSLFLSFKTPGLLSFVGKGFRNIDFKCKCKAKSK
jgi:hypothetical protein